MSNDEFYRLEGRGGEGRGGVLFTPTRSSSFTRYSVFSFFQAELALRKGFDQSEDAVISSILCFNL